MDTTGVLILPPYNQQADRLIATIGKHSQLLTNARLKVPHQLLQLTTKSPAPLWTVYASPQESGLDLTQTAPRYAAYLLALVKRSTQLLIVAPGPKLPLIYVLLATQKLPLTKIRLLAGSTLLTGPELTKALRATSRDQLQQQWQQISRPAMCAPKMAAPESAESAIIPTKSLAPTLKAPNGTPLRPYQQQMVDFALAHPRAGLFVDMGLGKTLATLATLSELVKRRKLNPTKPVLVVAPITVALDTWSREAEKWGYDMAVKINIKLKKKKREALLDSLSRPQPKLTLVTTNPDQLAAIIAYYREKQTPPPFEVAVVDELSQFKSASAKRFKNLVTLTQQLPYFYGLTGTPAPNNLLDVWPEMIAIDRQNRKTFGFNFYQYRQKFFVPDKIGFDGTVYSYRLKPHRDQQIYQLMKPTAFSMRSEGLIELPGIVYTKRYVKLPPKAQKLYNKMDQELRQKLNAIAQAGEKDHVMLDMDGGQVSIANNAVLTGKLAQLSSGAIYNNIMEITPDKPLSHNVPYTVFQDVKFQALKDIVESSDSPILVFFYFKSELERLAKYVDFTYLDPHDSDFQGIISRWNQGKIHVLAAHPASAGHGLNLQDGGHTMVWLTTPWSNEQYRQAVKRLYRSGQKYPVTVIHLLAENTVDEDNIARLNLKEEGQNDLMTALDIAKRSPKTT